MFKFDVDAPRVLLYNNNRDKNNKTMGEFMDIKLPGGQTIHIPETTGCSPPPEYQEAYDRQQGCIRNALISGYIIGVLLLPFGFGVAVLLATAVTNLFLFVYNSMFYSDFS